MKFGQIVPCLGDRMLHVAALFYMALDRFWLIQAPFMAKLGKSLKDVYKNYKNYIHRAKQQGNFTKENFTYTKMKEKFSKILEENVIEAPKQVPLELPKLKLPKLKLPNLKKV